MTFLRTVWKEFVGLFVDDGALALLVILLVAVVVVVVKILSVPASVGAFLLLIGCLGVLALSLVRTIRKR